MSGRVPDGYRLVADVQAVEDYVTLRTRAGLSPKSAEQAAAALPGAGRRETAPASVGMGLRRAAR